MGGERGFPMLAMAAALAVGTVLVTVAVAGDGPLVHSAGTPPARGTTAAAAQPSLLEAQQWLNTAPLRAEELRGKAIGEFLDLFVHQQSARPAVCPSVG
jgi:hypothetical protein